jgi:hypothetical protein
MLRAEREDGAVSNETRNLGFAVGVLVAFGALMVWVMTGPPPADSDAHAARPNEEPAAPDTASERPEPAAAAKATSPEPAVAAPPPSSDLFAAPMPDFMTDAHARVLDKKWLDAEAQKQLYQFGQEHKDDARPQLLLAWDSMNREWDGIAVRMYRIAYRADQRAKDEPGMLRDLLDVASRFDKTENREATELVTEAYGEQALPQLDASLADLRAGGDLMRAGRLERLRAAITGRSAR